MKFTLPTLYKTNSNGTIQEWTIRVDKSGEDGVIVTRWGVHNGEILETLDRVTEGKNKGKKNETNAYEQACAEAKSKWTKKHDKGYAEVANEKADLTAQVKTKAERVANGSVEPMLADKWKDVIGKLDPEMNVIAQIKLNGLRGVARKEDGKVVLYTRGGKTIKSVPGIVAELEQIMPEGATWDGELCTEDCKPTSEMFQRTVGAARRDHHTADADLLFYHIFDNMTIDVESLPYFDRIAPVAEIINKASVTKIKIVTSKMMKVKDVQAFEAELTADGYEGAMVRFPDAPYEHKRSKSLLKVKSFQDAEFEIVDVEPGRGIRSDKAGRVIFRLEDGRTCESSVSGSHEQAKILLDNKDQIIGKKCTIRYFNLTAEGKPYLPVFYGVREDE